MTQTPDLDETIKTLQGYLETAKTVKEKLQITDRLHKFYALKYKHKPKGRGAAFSAPTSLPETKSE
jgi:hypothetical protein